MSDLKKGDEESGQPRIRITLTSRNKDEVEKGSFFPTVRHFSAALFLA
jgi:hypothetical protein